MWNLTVTLSEGDRATVGAGERGVDEDTGCAPEVTPEKVRGPIVQCGDNS